MLMRSLLAVLCVSALACGGNSPTAPSTPPPPPASIAGAWTGTFQATQVTGGPYIIALVMTLNQSAANVTGTWATSQANGTVTGTTTTTSFSGTLTWNGVTNNGSSCTGTFAVSGTAGGPTLNWTSPAVTGNCGNLPTAITVAAQTR